MRGIGFRWIFLVIGLALFAVSTLIVIHTRKFIARAESARGTVVRMIGDSDGYTPVVQFRTATGRDITFQESGSANPPQYAVGERVQVLYLPKDPREARIDGELWLLPIALGGMGLVFAGIGGGILLSRERRLTNF